MGPRVLQLWEARSGIMDYQTAGTSIGSCKWLFAPSTRVGDGSKQACTPQARQSQAKVRPFTISSQSTSFHKNSLKPLKPSCFPHKPAEEVVHLPMQDRTHVLTYIMLLSDSFQHLLTGPCSAPYAPLHLHVLNPRVWHILSEDRQTCGSVG